MLSVPSLRVIASLTACLCLVGGTAAAQAVDGGAIAARFGATLDASSTAAVERGEVIVRVQPTADGRDVAIFGIARVSTSREAYRAGVQRFADWLRTPTRTRIGLFGQPATVANLAAMTVSRGDARDMRDCRAGDCKTKLSAPEMRRMHDGMDWAAADHQSRVSALTRQRLVEYVEAYRERGNAALPIYEDRAVVRAADAFEAVLAQSRFLTQAVPPLATYLRGTPRGRPAGVVDVMFWSEDAGARIKPILSVTHAVVWTPPDIAGTTLVVQKQVYANHYFEAAIEVLTVTDRVRAGEPPAIYLAIERRFRFDNLPRGGLLNIRGRAVNGLRDRLLVDLRREQTAHAPVVGR
ncbi:MAG TPA: hypothetical protein VE861_08420 [Gemmatimonadaceae bacterium]|nr:hypothetical protein [Gemmatimonadaceae bacterium]